MSKLDGLSGFSQFSAIIASTLDTIHMK